MLFLQNMMASSSSSWENMNYNLASLAFALNLEENMFPRCRFHKITHVSCCHCQHAESRITETQATFQTLNNVTESVAEYFCEEPSGFKLDECCSIFHSFCERFTRALQVKPCSSSQYKSVWLSRFTLS